MVTFKARLIFIENVIKVSCLFVNNFFNDLRKGSKETLVFRPFLKIGLTFANLKALGNLLKDIERLQISVINKNLHYKLSNIG